jgi:hypothetical protein
MCGRQIKKGDMIPEDEILFLVRVLARQPNRIKVSKTNDHPMTFEIRACNDDLEQLILREKIIRLMAGASGLIDIRLNFAEAC